MNIAAVLVALASAHAGQTPRQGPQEGLAIIRRMEAMYANLRSYSDTGTGAEGIKFRTFYKAKGKLYFEYVEDGQVNFICASGVKGKERREPGMPVSVNADKLVWMADAYVFGKVEQDALELEIAGFTGISRGTAYNVPTMIFPEMTGTRFHDSRDAKLIRKERFGGEECYVVDSKADQTTLWISTKTLALRKVEERDFDPAQVTTYDPVLNGKIEDSIFVFKPPRGSKKGG